MSDYRLLQVIYYWRFAGMNRHYPRQRNLPVFICCWLLSSVEPEASVHRDVCYAHFFALQPS